MKKTLAVGVVALTLQGAAWADTPYPGALPPQPALTAHPAHTAQPAQPAQLTTVHKGHTARPGQPATAHTAQPATELPGQPALTAHPAHTAQPAQPAHPATAHTALPAHPALVAANAGAGASLSAEGAIKRMKPCVVLIENTGPSGTGYGTGFLVSKDGYIVTNEHVVKGHQALTVYYKNKTKLRAKLVAKSREDDLALLKVEASEPFPTVKLGQDLVNAGVPIATTGYPLPPILMRNGLNLDSSSASGISSGLRTTDGSGLIPRSAMQMDVMTYGGNSGGPVFIRSTGEVVGVVQGGLGNSALNFAVPISRVKALLVDAGVQLQPNPLAVAVPVPPGDLSELNLISGSKEVHKGFGLQHQITTDYRTISDRTLGHSHAIYQMGLGSAPNLSTPLSEAGNSLFFGSLDGTLYRYDLEYQELESIAHSEYPFYFAPHGSSRKLVVASGVLVPDRELSVASMVANAIFAPVFGVDVHVVKGLGNLLAVNPNNGSVDWVVETRFLSEPVVTPDRVFAGSLDALTAYSLADGSQLWRVEDPSRGGDTHWYSPAPSDGRTVGSLVVPVRVEGFDELRGRDSSFAAAYDGQSGNLLWKKTLNPCHDWPRPMSGSSFADSAKDRLFVVHGDTVTAFRLSDGTELWSQPFRNRLDPSKSRPENLGPYFSPGMAVGGDTIYIGSEDKRLRALSATSGELLWERSTSGKVGIPTYHAGTVYAGSSDKYLYAMDATTGALQWKYNCGATISGRPVVNGKRVYCNSDSGSLYVVRIPK